MTKAFLFKHLTLLILGMVFLPPFTLFPCNVPVFRYALERWPADPYRLMIYSQDPLEASLQAAVQDLRALSFEGDSTLNLIIQVIDPGSYQGIK